MLLRKKLAVLLAAATMVVATMSASPALADGRSADAPNCERGQEEAYDAQNLNKSENDNPFKHFVKTAVCLIPR